MKIKTPKVRSSKRVVKTSLPDDATKAKWFHLKVESRSCSEHATPCLYAAAVDEAGKFLFLTCLNHEVLLSVKNPHKSL
jgi:hypothetical protein